MKDEKTPEYTNIGICRRCGRKLTNPVSQSRGLGDVCASKVAKENHHKSLLHSLHTDKTIV